MSKTYKLKKWDEVTEHHFISKERWDNLTECKLEAKFLDGILSSSAVIYPKGEVPTLGNTYIVNRDDLRELKRKVPTNASTVDETATATKEKTYTKDEIRAVAMDVMATFSDNENDAIVASIVIARLINKLN